MLVVSVECHTNSAVNTVRAVGVGAGNGCECRTNTVVKTEGSGFGCSWSVCGC